eukprot:CAMPEP_0181128240 /NCGR_PEP_ID=MMETSP1071-20121207/28641_1 /TAXON_ID=35127 /ORGANISM="Thalassiosira sp., Strain NH16" /LENGTH=64 /DNA_ID=CAMNT_0023214063 /DNA_START=9 /DNA_END=199 /DNA_ORIENTATION=-
MDNKPSTSTSSSSKRPSPVLPPPRKNFPKAPHMQIQNIPPSSEEEEIVGFMKKNPLLFAIVIFP